MKWILLILCASATAAEYCSTRIEGGTELIYWRACARGFAYREGKLLKPNYDWSFRVNGAMTSMDGVNYSSFGYLQFFSQNGDDPYALKFGYRTGEVQVGHDLLRGCAHNFTLFAGGRYVMVRRRDVGPVATATYRYEGGGPEIGCNGACLIAREVSVVGQLSMNAIIGVRQTEEVVKIQRQTTCIPGFRFRLGLSYTASGCTCIDLVGEIGFEFDAYIHVFAVNSLFQTIGFGGPYAAIWVRF